jgi:DNA-directed RNA polymerase subunit K/omega
MSDISEEYEHDDVGSEDSAASHVERTEASDIEEEIEAEEENADEEEVEQPFDIKSVSDYNKEVHIIPADERMTRNVLSVAEMTAITSIRAAQIQSNNNCLVDITGLNDPRLMARRELMEGKCPLYVRRRVDTGDGIEQYYEIWDPNTMAFATVYTDV